MANPANKQDESELVNEFSCLAGELGGFSAKIAVG